MRVLPKTDDDHPPILLVRTDYRDDVAWQRVLTALDQPWVFDERDEENGYRKEDILRVDDPMWEGASPADVLAALDVPGDGESGGGEPVECGWPVVFLADRAAMEGPEPTLLAVSTYPEETAEPYRIPALRVPHAMHCNLNIANMDFEDFQEFEDFE